MLTEEQIKQLKSENELLHLQLEDVNYMISIREDELEILRAKAKNAVKLQSQLEGTFNELGQMQEFIGRKQQEAAGAARREASMENEIIQSIKMEKDYYLIKSQLASASAALTDIDGQLSDSLAVYKELSVAKKQISELKSSLEIAAEETDLLKYELGRARQQNKKLQEGFDT